MLTCVVVALTLGALAAPAVAGAQAAKDEYKLQVPGSSGSSTPGGGASGGGSSSGGGAPIALIGLAAVAAACVGGAAWRLRSRGDDSNSDLRTGAPSATSESQ